MTLNIERIKQLREHISDTPENRVDLSVWFSSLDLWPIPNTTAKEEYHKCGTAACIAGHIMYLFAPDVRFDEYDISDLAAEEIGLGSFEAKNLFTPLPYYGAIREDYQLPKGRTKKSITKEEILLVLDHLIETGEVDWRVVTKEGEE